MLPMQIVELWGRILKNLRAATASRDLARIVEVIIEHAPAMKTQGAVKEALSDWKRITLLWLGPINPDKLEAESNLSAVEYQLLCRNRNGVVSFLAFLGIPVVGVGTMPNCKSVLDGVSSWCFMLIKTCLGASGHQQCHDRRWPARPLFACVQVNNCCCLPTLIDSCVHRTA